MNEYSHKVGNNLSVFDKVLSNIDTDTDLYKILFFSRALYCVLYERLFLSEKIRWTRIVTRILRFLYYLSTYPFFVFRTNNISEVVILNTCRAINLLRQTKATSEFMNIPILRFNKKICFPKYSRLKDQFLFMKCLFEIMKIKQLNLVKKIYLLPAMLESYKIYKELDLSYIKVILTYDDTLPIAASIVTKAKEQQVKSIRIEYANIDRISYNSVFCDYYFYPTSYHKMIREGSSWKNKVIYVEGGFVNVDFNAYKKTDISPNDKYISFFTGAQTLHKYSDSFYIKKILNMMQNDKILLVKIHPFENVSDYDYLKSNPNVRLYTYNQISNPELILMSSICISQFSTLTYEAKYFCENAFFINFEWKEDYLYDDLSYVNEYIEIIDSLDFLKKVLYREHATIPIEKYRKNFNMTYPNTFETLESFISNCIKEHIK